MGKGEGLLQGRTQDFFIAPWGSKAYGKAYMPKKVPNTQRIINVILKIVNIVFSRGAVAPPPRCVRPWAIIITLPLTATINGQLTNQMCLIYPTNQSNVFDISD